MNFEIDTGHILTMVGAFAAALFAAGRMLLWQFESRLKERFETMEKSQQQSNLHLEEKFDLAVAQRLTDAKQLQQLERDFLKLQAEMPIHYVRRDDYVRNQTVIEAKIDSIALRIENIQLKGLQRE